MAEPPKIELKPFCPEYQELTKHLILSGLADHWGQLDPAKNPDLNDIAFTYAEATFLTAWLENRLVGTGALVPHGDGVAEIVRMSVARDLRRGGIGRRILAALVQQGRELGFQRIILETTETWSEVVKFYLSYGFRITHYKDGDVYFALELSQ